MGWQQANQAYVYGYGYGYANANETAPPEPFVPDQATGCGMQDVLYETAYLKVPVRREYERSATADSACSITSRTPSLKRRSCDHDRDHDAPELTRTESKRARRSIAGTRAVRTDKEYFCTHPECDRKFDRLCEAKKHFKAKHTPLQLKPHGCTIDGCDFRGMWPKDIRRHLKQMHGVVAPTGIVVNTTNVPNTNVSYEGTLANSQLEIAPNEEEKSKTPNMATLAQAFSMFKKLRIRSQSIDANASKFIMVTKDQKSFRDVDVTGTDSVDSLLRRIKNALDLHDFETENAVFHRWNRGGARKVGGHLTRQALLDLVKRSANAEGTLRLSLRPPQAVLPPAHADPHSVIR